MLTGVFVAAMVVAAASNIFGLWTLKLDTPALYREVGSPPLFTIDGAATVYRLVLVSGLRARLCVVTRVLLTVSVLSQAICLAIFATVLLRD